MEILLSDIRLAAIDFESLPARDGHFPIQIGIALGGTSGIESSWQSPLSDAALAGAADAPQNAPRLLSLWPEIRKSLEGRWVVAHGSGTEKKYLRVFAGHRFGPWIDTLRWARAVFPGLKSHALGEVCDALKVELPPGSPPRWHDAEFDAIACLCLIQHLWRATGLRSASRSLLTAPDLSSYFAGTGRRGASPGTAKIEKFGASHGMDSTARDCRGHDLDSGEGRRS